MDDNVNIFQEMVGNREIDIQEAPDAPKTNETTPVDKLDVDTKHLLVKDHFGFDKNMGVDDTEMLRKIADMLVSGDKEDAERELRDIESVIGKPRMGVNRVQHVFNYLTLMQSARKAMRNVNSYVDNGGDKVYEANSDAWVSDGYGATGNNALNLCEINNSETVQMGVQTTNLQGTFKLQPVPDITHTMIWIAKLPYDSTSSVVGSQGSIAFFSYPNQFDGTCD